MMLPNMIFPAHVRAETLFTILLIIKRAGYLEM